MIPANPIPRAICLRSGETLVNLQGWETSHTLGVYQTAENGFASCLLMGGFHLIDGFESPRQAHEFNKLVLAHPKLFTGTCRLEEFFERGGGKANAWNELVKLRAKAMEKKA